MQEQRYLPALRAHIDHLLGKGWEIAGRNPLTLKFGRKTCVVMHGMLIGEGPLWNQSVNDLLSTADGPQPGSSQTPDSSELAKAAVAG
jgi:hypothetical protein